MVGGRLTQKNGMKIVEYYVIFMTRYKFFGMFYELNEIYKEN